MRKPFRKIASGMTKATSTRRRHGVFKNRFAARMLVIKRIQLDRMPLHSCATWIVMFGSWKTRPSRRKGVLLRRKKTFATSAEAYLEAVSSAFAIASGIGTMKMRYASGKAAARIQSLPRKKKPPAAIQQRKDRVRSARRSFSTGARPAKSNQEVPARTP